VQTILTALDECGLAEDTIVVFTSDHGEQMGDHGILGKTVMYEESVRVPMLIRAPMLGRESLRIEGNFSHIDLVPTLLDLMGVPASASLQGTSRVPVLQGNADLADNDVFIEWNGTDGHPSASIGEAEINRSMAEPLRTVISAQRWKLNLYDGGPGELYDLNSDPHEQQNLYEDPTHSSQRRDLADRLRQWQLDVGDTVELPDV